MSSSAAALAHIGQIQRNQAPLRTLAPTSQSKPRRASSRCRSTTLTCCFATRRCAERWISLNSSNAGHVYDEAWSLIEQSLQIQETKVGEHHLDALASLNNLASVLKEQAMWRWSEQLHSLRGRANTTKPSCSWNTYSEFRK